MRNKTVISAGLAMTVGLCVWEHSQILWQSEGSDRDGAFLPRTVGPSSRVRRQREAAESLLLGDLYLSC